MIEEVKNVQTPANARKRRFSSNNEPSKGPTLDEAVAERALTARSTGGKAVHSGAFDTLEQVPEPLKVTKDKR